MRYKVFDSIKKGAIIRERPLNGIARAEAIKGNISR